MKPIEVLIVDDQTLFAESMKIVLEGYDEQEIRVVGLAHDGREAISLVKKLKPDLILMDVRMPVVDGVEATRQIHSLYPDVKILMLTTFEEDSLVENALKNGASGYILKEVQPKELVESIKAVNDGFFLVSPSIGSRLFEKAVSVSREAGDKVTAAGKIRAAYPDLSKREAEVLYYMARSYDNHEIADLMFLAEQTVKNYITSIYGKLEVRDRIHCIRMLNDKTGGI